MTPSPRVRVLMVSWLLILAGGVIAGQQPQRGQSPQAPTFRSSVEVTTLDVTVIDNDGRPVADLRPPDFTVRIDGKPRRVVRVEWVPLTRPATSRPPWLKPASWARWNIPFTRPSSMPGH